MERNIFIQQYFPNSIRQARAGVITRLLRFCLNGLDYKEHGDVMKLVDDEVKSALYDRMSSGIKLTKKIEEQMTKLAGNTAEYVVSAYKNASQFYHIRSLVIPWLDDEELESKFKESFLTYRLKEELTQEDGSYQPSVRGAYACALDNWHLTQTKLVTTSVIRDLVAPSQYINFDLGGLNKLRTILWKKQRDYTFDVLLFGSMLGGSEAAEALELAASTRVYDEKAQINYAIMQFLQLNRRSPGRWFTETEDAFRQDIEAKLKERCNG